MGHWPDPTKAGMRRWQRKRSNNTYLVDFKFTRFGNEEIMQWDQVRDSGIIFSN